VKAISVRAPWWYAILYLGKPVENRDWYTNVRGRVALHAGKWFDPFEVAEIWRWEVMPMWKKANPGRALPPMPELDVLRRASGCLVGTVEIMGCVMSHPSPWFVGKWGHLLANPAPLAAPLSWKGALGYFELPESALGGMQSSGVMDEEPEKPTTISLIKQED
jgi:hypothetical protein